MLGDDTIVELDAPVIKFGMLTSHCCVQVGLESVLPPHIAGESRTKLVGFDAVMDIAGLLAALLLFIVLVGIGFARSTPEKEYAPTTAEVEFAIVTIIFPVPLGFLRYQNAA